MNASLCRSVGALILVLLFFAAAAADGTGLRASHAPLAHTPPAGFERVADGLAYRQIRLPVESTGARVAVHVFAVALASHTLRVLPAAAGRGASVSTLARQHSASLAVNGGFFLDDFTPLGLLVSEGRELNPLRRADWGVFFVRDGVARIVHRRDFVPDETIEFAVQSGPRLVVDGAPLTFKPQVARRTALGIDGAGRVFLLVTEGAMLLAELADFLRRPVAEGGLACQFALNLDGGSSSQLHFTHGDRRITVSGAARVANAIGVFPREILPKSE